MLEPKRKESVYTRSLARAIEIAGGVEPLADFLGCSAGDVRRWTSGESHAPMPIFLAMVDILAANALTPVALENLPAARARLSRGRPASGRPD
ncbi:MAG TPA: hypothetical protein VM489_11670 [Burkholderiales bacterium]|nr:hypothetical protein [Burkholderiales bacterium]